MNEILKLMEQLDDDNKSKIMQRFSMQEESLSVMQEERFGLLETAKVLLSKNREQNLVISELRQRLRESEVAGILQIKQEESKRLEEELQRTNAALHGEQIKCLALEEEHAKLKESHECLQRASDEVQKKNSEMEQRKLLLEAELSDYKKKCLQIEQECSSLKEEISAANMHSARIQQENELMNAQLQELRGSLDAFVDLLTL